jgi:acetylornithine deacetylase/succinyl-diaminopimelate desuccinylase-like protein
MSVDSLLVDRVLDLAVRIQQVPAPTFSEARRASLILSLFRREELADVGIDEAGNVYARLPGAQTARPVVVSAHLDTVFPETTALRVARHADRITGPGIGDNALGLAGLFGLLWHSRQNNHVLPGDLWLVADVGEEGRGDLRGMRAVVERFQDGPLAYIVLEGMALGQIYHRGLGVRRYRIEFHTRGGHSWVDHGKASAIHEMAALIGQITALPVPAKPRTTLNVGVVGGGYSVNTIAAEAYLELDLRSEGRTSLQHLVASVEALVEQSQRGDVQVHIQTIGDRPFGEIPADHPLVCLAERSLRAVGLKAARNIGSTDANIPLSLGLPAVCIGLTTGEGAHTTRERISTGPLRYGLAQLAYLVEGVFEDLS